MTVTTNERGQQNMFAKEPRMYVSQTDAERYGYETYAERAEKLNGRTAMLGFIAAVVSYATRYHCSVRFLCNHRSNHPRYLVMLILAMVLLGAFILASAITERSDEDDDDFGGGMMIPASIPSQ